MGIKRDHAQLLLYLSVLIGCVYEDRPDYQV